MSFWELFKTNLRVVYRNRAGIFWNIILPVVIYSAISVLPINKFVQTGTDYSTYLLPGFIALTIMQAGIYSLAYWMIDLKSQGVIKRFLVTPIKKGELILSVLAARVLVILVQVVLLTLAGILLFDAQFTPANFPLILLFSILGGFIFLLVGLFISTLAGSYEAAAPITSAIGLPLTFLSNVFYPLETLSGVLQSIARFLPITHLSDALRTLYLQPLSLSEIYKEGLILLVWLGVLLIVVIWRLKLEDAN